MLISMLIATFMGSSPRVRGKQDVIREAVKMAGLIPACAGKTRPAHSDYGHSGAHPRVCGENTGWVVLRLSIVGSSPRVRGKHCGSRERTQSRRLIPACAGKTALAYKADQYKRAHPRVCGENRR